MRLPAVPLPEQAFVFNSHQDMYYCRLCKTYMNGEHEKTPKHLQRMANLSYYGQRMEYPVGFGQLPEWHVTDPRRFRSQEEYSAYLQRVHGAEVRVTVPERRRMTIEDITNLEEIPPPPPPTVPRLKSTCGAWGCGVSGPCDTRPGGCTCL
jgi:hypothetical protein